MEIQKKGKRGQTTSKATQLDSAYIHDRIVRVESEMINEYYRGYVGRSLRDVVLVALVPVLGGKVRQV